MAADSKSKSPETEPTTPKKPKAERSLPTPRVKVEKQLDVLKAYAAKSGYEKKAVSNADISAIVEMTPSTISLVNPFLADIGLLRKTDGGYVPAEEVFNYLRATQFKSPMPGAKLAPVFQRSWFFESIQPVLALRPLAETEAVATLAETGGAGEHHLPSLNMLVEYLVVAGLVLRVNGSLTLPDPTVAPSAPPPSDAPAEPVTRTDPPVPTRAAQPVTMSSMGAPDGVMQFHATINISMAQLATWSPDRITAFMGGLAKVIAAQGGHEEK